MGVSPALRFAGKVEQERVTVLLETNVQLIQCERTDAHTFSFCQPEWVVQSPLLS